MNSMFVT